MLTTFTSPAKNLHQLRTKLFAEQKNAQQR